MTISKVCTKYLLMSYVLIDNDLVQHKQCPTICFNTLKHTSCHLFILFLCYKSNTLNKILNNTKCNGCTFLSAPLFMIYFYCTNVFVIIKMTSTASAWHMAWFQGKRCSFYQITQKIQWNNLYIYTPNVENTIISLRV